MSEIEPEFESRSITSSVKDGSAEGFFLTAAEYRVAVLDLMAAQNYRPGGRVHRPLQHLAGLCLELFLKSYLIQKGTPLKKLRHDYGHGLTKLMKKAIDAGLVIDHALQDEVVRASPAFSTHFYRYGVQSNTPYPVPIPNLQVIAQAIDVLASEVARELELPW